MLNLAELEAKVNEALARETKESLLLWLHEKRVASFFSSLGDGEMIAIDGYKEEVTAFSIISTKQDTQFVTIDIFCPDFPLAEAA